MNEYAVLSVGSEQAIVSTGDFITVDKMENPVGDKVTLNDVLLVKKGDDVQIGAPFVKGATVEAEIVAEEKGPKLAIMYKRRRKHSQKKIGHRQHYTLLKIGAIKGA